MVGKERREKGWIILGKSGLMNVELAVMRKGGIKSNRVSKITEETLRMRNGVKYGILRQMG